MAPIIGKAHIAYLPKNRVVGISKLARVLHGYARRLQVQERLTAEVADAIWEHLQPQGVAVVIEASHACMTARGVRHPGRDDDHQPDDGRVPRRPAQPPRSARSDGLLARWRSGGRLLAGMLVLLAGCGSSQQGEGLTPEQINALGLGRQSQR